MEESSNSSDVSETGEFEDTEIGQGGPFKDDPVWTEASASACDVQGGLGKNIISLWGHLKPFAKGLSCVMDSCLQRSWMIF